MTYYGATELAASFRTVRNNTLIIARDIPEDQYGFAPASGCRTVARTLVHIVGASRMQQYIQFEAHISDLAKFDFPSFVGKLRAEEETPRTKAQILELLESEGGKFEAQLAGLSESFLGEQVSYPPGMTPPAKSRFEMLLGVKEHEMHHRAQLMVVERMLGITPHLTRQMEERIKVMQAGRS